MKTLLLYILRRFCRPCNDLDLAFGTISSRALDGANHDEKITLYQCLSSVASGLQLYEQAKLTARIAAELRHADTLQMEFLRTLETPNTKETR